MNKPDTWKRLGEVARKILEEESRKHDEPTENDTIQRGRGVGSDRDGPVRQQGDDTV